MEENHRYLHENVPNLAELFGTCDEMINFIMAQGGQKAGSFLADLASAVDMLALSINKLLPLINYPNKLREISTNMPLLIKRLCMLFMTEEFETLDMKLRCELRPLFLFWREYFTFFMVDCIDDEHMSRQNKLEQQKIEMLSAEPKIDVTREYRYDLSIVVLLYGNQKITSECIDAIHRYTTHRSYELITCDNGSDDQTAAWVQSLPHTKKIQYPLNVGSSVAGNTLITYACEYIDGKYLAFISNDVIVTPGWDLSLFACMESDPRIIMAVPVTNSLSNLQTIPVPYPKNDLTQMQRFAKGYNALNPRLWSERARLFAIMGLIRQDEIAKFRMFCSPYFCFDMFADDDSSTQIRRAGYKQVLCRDVFVHHYGSATIGDGQFDVMNKGRLQFYNKYGIDAWDGMGWTGMIFAQLIESYGRAKASILVFEPHFGESSLAVKNRLRELGCKEFVFDAITTDARFLVDMRQIFDSAEMLSNSDIITNGKQYDFILYEGHFEESHEMSAYAKIAKEHLNPDGNLMLLIKNMHSVENIQGLLSGQDLCKRYEKEKELDPTVSMVSLGAMKSFLLQHQLLSQTVVQIDTGRGKGKAFLSVAGKLLAPSAKAALAKVIDVDSYAIICN